MKTIKTLWRLSLAKLPTGLVRFLMPGDEVYRGASIDTKARAVGRLANLMRVPGEIPSPAESRIQLRKMVTLFDAPGPDILLRQDIIVKGAAGDLAARIYADSPDQNAPAMVYFHGGGFVQGDLESHDFLCAKLAKFSGGKIIAVEYRLAPENVYPAGLNDAKAAFQDICARAGEFGIDPARTGVGGDSAGGSFSAVLMQCGKPFKPAFQVLIYPTLDSHMDSPSIHDLKDAYVIPYDRMMYYRAAYLADFKDYDHPDVSPLLVKDLSKTGPSYVLVGGFDPLLDDAENYVKRLKQAGIPVTYRLYPGQIHAFLNLTKVIPEGTKAIHEIADWLRKTW